MIYIYIYIFAASNEAIATYHSHSDCLDFKSGGISEGTLLTGVTGVEKKKALRMVGI